MLSIVCLSARMSVSSVHLTQHNGRVEERGLAAGGLKACARVEQAFTWRRGSACSMGSEQSAQSWEGRRTSIGSWLAGWLAGCWEYVEARQSGSLLFWQTRADASTCNSKAAGEARQARQGDDVARAAVDEDSARVELAVVMLVQAGWTVAVVCRSGGVVAGGESVQSQSKKPLWRYLMRPRITAKSGRSGPAAAQAFSNGR